MSNLQSAIQDYGLQGGELNDEILPPKKVMEEQILLELDRQPPETEHAEEALTLQWEGIRHDLYSRTSATGQNPDSGLSLGEYPSEHHIAWPLKFH